MGRRVEATLTWPREAPDVSVSVNGVNSPCAHEGCHEFSELERW
jgi:hypothetical protein